MGLLGFLAAGRQTNLSAEPARFYQGRARTGEPFAKLAQKVYQTNHHDQRLNDILRTANDLHRWGFAQRPTEVASVYFRRCPRCRREPKVALGQSSLSTSMHLQQLALTALGSMVHFLGIKPRVHRRSHFLKDQLVVRMTRQVVQFFRVFMQIKQLRRIQHVMTVLEPSFSDHVPARA